MKKLTDLIKEDQSTSLDADILVIVDVQKIFGKFIPKDFEKKLNKYCQKFKYVYQIWDSNKINKPSYIFTNQIRSIRKNYGTKFSKKIVKITNDLNKKYPNVKEGDVFKVGKNYLVKINNNHGWFYLNNELISLYKELNGKKVIIVGGADNECIEDVYISMKSFNINVIYNHEYIYSVETNNQQQSTIK
jgi:hypothetical protein